jgi:multidrug resistance efflux pump
VVTIMIVAYAAVVLMLFKLKLLKSRPFPIAWTAVVGMLLIGAIVVAWKLCAPMSPRAVTTQYVVQLVSYVKGQVLKVHAQANQPVRKGDLLLEINPEPYQYTVNQVEAELAAAKNTVKQSQAALEKAGAGINQAQAALTQAKAALANAQASLTKARAALANAQAGVAKARAADDLARTEEQIALNLRQMDAGAISTLRVTQAVQNRQAADAALKQAETGVGEAQAGVEQAQAGINQTQAGVFQAEAGLAEAQAGQQQAKFALQVAQSNVPAVQAQLDDARFNLAACRMTAPDDGYVVNWQVQEGTMITTVRVSACGTFIVTTDTSIVASFPQNYLMNVQPGDEVEMVLDPYPGRLFKGRVDTVIPATGEGQFAPSGTIPDASRVGSQGLLAVKIRLTDEVPPAILPLGAGGTVAIYTDHGKPVHVISKVTIRMKKWLLYVLPTVKMP